MPVLCSTLHAEEPEKLLLLSVFILILSSSHRVYPTRFVFCCWVFPHPVSILSCKHPEMWKIFFLAGSIWKQSLHGPSASKWVMDPLGITFGPIASFVVQHLNLWVSTKMPFRRTMRKPEWCLGNVCKTDRKSGCTPHIKLVPQNTVWVRALNSER